MIYTMSATSLMGNLASNGNRNASHSIYPHFMPAFYVHSAGYSGQLKGQEAAVFSGASNVKILRAKIEPVLAKGLRPSFDSIFDENSYAATFGVCVQHGNIGGYAEIFLQTFEQFEECNIEIPAAGERVKFNLSNAVIFYDALGIKDEYKGQPFYIRAIMDVEIADEVIRT